MWDRPNWGRPKWHAQVDTDGTGEIDFLEFGRMMQPEKRIFQARPAAGRQLQGYPE